MNVGRERMDGSLARAWMPSLIRRCCLVLFGLFLPLGLAPVAEAATVNGCGTLAANTVWSAGNVYVLNNCATVVPVGITLTVQPGAVVKFAAASDVLLVQGTLLAQGTAGSPIAFTSWRDDSRGGDTNGDGASTGHTGDWSSLRFAAGSHGRLENVFLGYGGSGAFDRAGRYTEGMLESFSTDVTLDHVTLRSSAKSGLYCDNASVRVTFGEVGDNGSYGLYWNGVDPAVPLVVSDTAFSGNGAAGWLHFRDAAGTITFERNSTTGAKNGFRVDGRLNQGALVWDNAGNLPLVINPGVQIAPSTTLTLTPGSVVKLEGASTVLDIQGTLQSEGTSGLPIVVTSASDDAHGGDTNGDGVSTGARGQWASVYFEAGSRGRVAHTSFAYGGSGAFDYSGRYAQGSVQSYSSDVILDHVAVRSSGNSGMYCDNASVRVSYAEVADNGHYGLYWHGVDAAVPLVVSDTTFSGNTTAAGWLHFRDAAGTVTFERNAATGPKNGFRADGRLNQGALTWNNGDDLPLLIGGGLTIAPATTLALEPGSVVKFGNASDMLLVQGTLDAQGTAGASIALTSLSDDAFGGDTNGDGASQGSPGQWSAVRFAAGSTGRLAYVFLGHGGSGAFDYAGRYTLGMLESFSSDVTLDHCTLHASGIDGLYAENVTVTVSNGTVSDNTRYGLFYNGIDALVPLTVAGNVFSGATGSAARVDLRGNPPQITFLGNTASGSLRRGFGLKGTVTSDTVWDNTGSLPLVIDGGLTVAAGATLTVQPGTVVKFAGPGDVLLVQGELVATGTALAPIAFTSLRDDSHGGDTNGDGASSGAPGAWSAVRFAAGSAGQVAYAFFGFGGSGAFDYAGRYTRGMLESFSSAVTVDHCTLHASAQDGLYATASSSVIGSQVTANVGNGVYFDGVDPATALAVRDNTFSGNAGYGAWVRVANSAGQIAVERNQSVAPKNGLRMSGTLTQGSLLWDNPAAPVVVDGGLAIGALATLTVAPGSVVKFADGGDVVQVEGTLDAPGTFDAPIAFTSVSDDAHGGDTNGDGSSAGSRGQWSGLRVLTGGRVQLRHAFVGYGGSGAFDHLGFYGRGTIDLRGGALRMDYGALRGSALHGLYAENAEVRIAYAGISDHQQNGIHNATPGLPVDARHNWWGDPSGPKHPTFNPTGTGSPVSNGVLFDPWLNRFTWLEPTTVFLHGVAALSWTAFDVAPANLTTDVDANGATGTQVLGRGVSPSGGLEWDTRPLADGRYELRAVWRDASATSVGAAVRSVIVNNDPAIAWHGGRLTANETWSAGQVHVVEEDVVVGAGVRLTIQPGTIVKFTPGTRLVVAEGGVLDAPATEGAPILLTAVGDDAGGDTNLDGSDSLPRPGDWNGVVTQGSGQFNDNRYVDIRYSRSEHSGLLSADERWLGSLVHHVAGDVTVPSGVTLTIEAGAVVKFDAHKGLVVQPGGHLIALGAVAEPIVLTSSRDDTAGGDTNNDGDQTTPQAGDWRWVYVDGAAASFDHVEMRYGGGTSSGSWEQTGMIRTAGAAALTVTNSVLRDAFFDGILAWGGEVTVRSTVLTGIDRAIAAHPGSPVHVVNCTLDDNRIGLLVHGGTMDVANTIVGNSIESGIQYDFGTLASVRYTDVWAAAAPAYRNYRNTDDATGRDGNVSADPGYKDRERGNYRLDFESPVIDAADGSAAPATDTVGAPRYDDPRTANTGTATAGGAFADMGAFEFVETAYSNVDLVVSSVSGPTAAVVGDRVRVQWTVTNVGSGEVVGPWHDTVNLVSNSDTDPTVIFAAEVLVADGVRLGPGQSVTLSAEIRVPGGTIDEHRWQVVTNQRGDVYEGANARNNGLLSVAPVAVDVPTLALDTPVNGVLAAGGTSMWYAFRRVAGREYVLEMDADEQGPRIEMFVKADAVPTREDYEQRSDPAEPAAHRLVVSGGSDGYYYLLVVAPGNPAPASYTLTLTEQTALTIAKVVPSVGDTAGPTTFEVRGTNFTGETRVFLGAQAQETEAVAVFFENSSVLYATFDTPTLAPGDYDLILRDSRVDIGDQGAVTERDVAASSADAVRIASGAPGALDVRMSTRDLQRAGRPFDVWLTYTNRGGSDLPAPILLVQAPSAALRIENDDTVYQDVAQFLARSSSGPANRLRPGQAETVRISVTPHPSLGNLTISVGEATAGAGAPDIELVAEAAGIPVDTEWGQVVVANLRTLFGATWESYLAECSDLAYDFSFAPPMNSIVPLLRYAAGLSVPETEPPASVSSADRTDVTSGGGGSLLCDPPPVPPDHKRFDSWPTGPDYEEDPAQLVLYKGYLRPIYQGTKNIGRYKYASIHLEHFMDNTGTPLNYPKDHEFSKEVQRDPGLLRFVQGDGGEFGVALKKMVKNRGEPMNCGEKKYISETIRVTTTDPGLGISWQNANAQQGIGGVDTAIMEVAVTLTRDRDRVTATGRVKAHLRDFYHWAGHRAYHDANYSPPWNWWATYLEYYCEAKGFTIDIDLGEFPIEAWANVSVKGDPDSGGQPCKETPKPPKPPVGPPKASTSVKLAGSYDPNEKVASGTGVRGYIGDAEFIAYTVRFENKATATAPAQEVVITDQLDSNLDWATLELVSVGFNDRLVEIPRGRLSYEGVTTVGSDPNPVRIRADLDVATGLLRLQLRSEDALTHELPEDPLAGFLPPNDAAHHGEGFLSFTVKPRADLAVGARILNQARIVFDVNEAIDTNEVTNTVGPAPLSCPGDCDNRGTVGIDELLAGIEIGLGRAAVSACAALDSNADARVTVDELVAAVGFALHGCPQTGPAAVGMPHESVWTAPPTAVRCHTPTPTPTPTSSASAAPQQLARIPHQRPDRLRQIIEPHPQGEGRVESPLAFGQPGRSGTSSLSSLKSQGAGKARAIGDIAARRTNLNREMTGRRRGRG